jgi:hypothetical protein
VMPCQPWDQPFYRSRSPTRMILLLPSTSANFQTVNTKCMLHLLVRVPSGPAYLTTILACSHQVIAWEEHYRTLVAKRNNGIFKVISPKIGLHPLVRAYTDILSMTKLEPKEISFKLQADFAMDPMFIQSCPVRDIITQQICSRVRLIHSEQVENDLTQKKYLHPIYT